jgi:hypothetical protein
MPRKIDFVIDEVNEEATVTVDDQAYRIFFDLTAIYAFYRVFGINPVFEPIGFDPLRWVALLWGGLVHYQPEIDPGLVRSWFDGASMSRLVEGTWQAFRMFLPKPDEEKKGVPADPPQA